VSPHIGVVSATWVLESQVTQHQAVTHRSATARDPRVLGGVRTHAHTQPVQARDVLCDQTRPSVIVKAEEDKFLRNRAMLRRMEKIEKTRAVGS
jgi:hypothetical protein